MENNKIIKVIIQLKKNFFNKRESIKHQMSAVFRRIQSGVFDNNEELQVGKWREAGDVGSNVRFA